MFQRICTHGYSFQSSYEGKVSTSARQSPRTVWISWGKFAMAMLDQSCTRLHLQVRGTVPHTCLLFHSTPKSFSLRVEAESSRELFSCSFKPSFPFFFFLILTSPLVRIKGTNVPFHSLPKPCLPTQLEPSKMPDQIIPWEKYYDDSQKGKNTF